MLSGASSLFPLVVSVIQRLYRVSNSEWPKALQVCWHQICSVDRLSFYDRKSHAIEMWPVWPNKSRIDFVTSSERGLKEQTIPVGEAERRQFEFDSNKGLSQGLPISATCKMRIHFPADSRAIPKTTMNWSTLTVIQVQVMSIVIRTKRRGSAQGMLSTTVEL